ncbi:hypothetical protein M493_05770 [Geobacillus genomosp. 3]|uniref:Uncharacterized protein n=1 Tax=Geobacillus genomosp. 3 TaxID=1921421 RepID=S5Z376_GEOG3|nr:hypothetical protein M493_05770 [Geobacillus genomosp. 3]
MAKNRAANRLVPVGFLLKRFENKRATMKGTVALERPIAASRGRWKPGIGARVNITLEFHAEATSRPWRVIPVTNEKWAVRFGHGQKGWYRETVLVPCRERTVFYLR